VLLDECVSRKLARLLPGHSIQTVAKAGWASFKNGNLLRVAQFDFDVLVTTDRHFSAQQNVSKFDIAIIVLPAKSNHISDIEPFVPELLEAIPVEKPGAALVLKAP